MPTPAYSTTTAAAPPSAVEGGEAGDPDFARLISRPHPVWSQHALGWRKLMDSYVGGDAYIRATYGVDRRGLPVRNLIRHKREYPDPTEDPNNTAYGTPGVTPASMLGGAEYAVGIGGAGLFGPWPGTLGADVAATAHDDDYEYRRARTVPPPFVEEAVCAHLSKVYDQEVKREGPDDLVAWWADVDGRGTPMDDWMRDTVAPLLLVLGCLDVCLDHPRPPEGAVISTRAHELRLGLDRCVATYILPQNTIWWRLDRAGRYAACLIREFVDPSGRDDSAIDGSRPFGSKAEADRARKDWTQSYVRYRYWDAEGSILVDHEGRRVIERTPHRFGCVPIVRLMDRHDFHQDNVGKSRYESTASYMRAYYNLDSELIVSNTVQAHALLSGPEDFARGDGKLAVGPMRVLVKKKNPENGHYEGWEYVSPPKDPADSLRRDKQDIRDAVDRINCLAKPAGSSSSGGTGASTVSQSGLSKQMDHQSGHKLLRSIVKPLAKGERTLAEYALMVLRGVPVVDLTPADREAIRVAYPSKFELRAAGEMAADTVQFQLVLSQSGKAPRAEADILQAMVRQILPDRSDREYDAIDAEIEEAVAAQATVAEQQHEATLQGIADASEVEGDGSGDEGAGRDALGQSAATAVGGIASYRV